MNIYDMKLQFFKRFFIPVPKVQGQILHKARIHSTEIVAPQSLIQNLNLLKKN